MQRFKKVINFVKYFDCYLGIVKLSYGKAPVIYAAETCVIGPWTPCHPMFKHEEPSAE